MGFDYQQQREALVASHRQEIDTWKTEVDSLQLLLANPEEGRRLLEVTMALLP